MTSHGYLTRGLKKKETNGFESNRYNKRFYNTGNTDSPPRHSGAETGIPLSPLEYVLPPNACTSRILHPKTWFE